MFNNIIIFDIDSPFIEEAKRLNKYGIKTIKSDVNVLLENNKIDGIVSPANSFGYMNGGIDNIYKEIFPNIQQTVQNTINNIGLMSDLNKNYLPVGSAITVKTNNHKCPNLICAPTMYLPGNIKNTCNIIYCFLAIIYLAKMNPNSMIACPGLGTGIGMLTPKDAIDQMEFVIMEYDFCMNLPIYQNTIIYRDKMNIILKEIPYGQSKNL